jgi:hypothetical protein
VGGGVQVGPLDTAATNRPIVPAPGDYDDGEIWWNNLQGKPKYSEKTCPSFALSTTNSTCCPDGNPGRRCGKPATNRLSYGTAWKSSVSTGSVTVSVIIEILTTAIRSCSSQIKTHYLWASQNCFKYAGQILLCQKHNIYIYIYIYMFTICIVWIIIL